MDQGAKGGNGGLALLDHAEGGINRPPHPHAKACVLGKHHFHLFTFFLLCFDKALLSNVEGLSMNGRNYNDFKIATVRPEPVEGPFSIFTRGTIYTDFSVFARKATRPWQWNQLQESRTAFILIALKHPQEPHEPAPPFPR
ncbi:MAG: hypothetical protein ACD_74C00185G0001 [uncultured bacterium]|nr:MAG: hypothetical protein ACD_74C00185G0001 [uncultured bacterium]